MTGFRNQKWDPWLIVSQIVTVQTIYYFGLGFWVFCIASVLSRGPTLDYFFTYDVLQLTNWTGRLLTVAFLLNALSSALAIVYLVGRYKQCLDFSLTVHFYHFLACSIYNFHYPNTFSWYVIQILSVVIMTILSEHFSKKNELRNIPLTSRVDL